MKKISLKNLNLSETETLSREQLKNVLGGAGSGSTTDACPKDTCGGALGACTNNRSCNSYPCASNSPLTYKDCGPVGVPEAPEVPQ